MPASAMAEAAADAFGPTVDGADILGLGGSLNIINESFDVSTSDDWSDFSPKLALQYLA